MEVAYARDESCSLSFSLSLSLSLPLLGGRCASAQLFNPPTYPGWPPGPTQDLIDDDDVTGAGCLDTPPSDPPAVPDGFTHCEWVKVEEIENWIGPPSVNGPNHNPSSKFLVNISWMCGKPVQCDTEDLPVGPVTYEKKTIRRWNVGSGVSVEAATRLKAPLVARVDIKGGFDVETDYGGETIETLTIPIGGDGWVVKPCHRFKVRVDEDTLTATGSIQEAQYRVRWCNSCVCGDAVDTFCNLKTATGSAKNGVTYTIDAWEEVCECITCCEE